MQINSNGKLITLNSDQEAGLQEIDKWYKTGGWFFTLSGPAGSGKTTIVKAAIEDFKKPLRISAPTHKACRVVAKATGLPSLTIQAMCGLRPDTVIEDINNKKFVPTVEPKIKDYNVIIIDEASMLGEKILELIMELAVKHRTKVLFMGDIYQLPPVKEKVSPVFTHSDIPSFQLTKVERQKDSNPLMGIYDKIRSNIYAEHDLFIHKTEINEKGEGVQFYNEGQEFFNKVMTTFGSEDYAGNPLHAKVLAWKNATVKSWNGFIRQQRYGLEAKAVEKDEILMSYTNYWDDALNRTLIMNSGEYKICEVKETFIHIDGTSIDIFQTLMEDVEDQFAIKVPINLVVPTQENYKKFIAKWHPLKVMALRNNAWRGYTQFKNMFMLMEDLRDHEGKLLIKKDFDYAYAMTVHKCQGSTYSNVFVHEDDLDKNKDETERNHLKYVAFSRPTTMAYVLSNKTVEHERIDTPAAELVG